jgi:hypothetical protein
MLAALTPEKSALATWILTQWPIGIPPGLSLHCDEIGVPPDTSVEAVRLNLGRLQGGKLVFRIPTLDLTPHVSDELWEIVDLDHLAHRLV